jgi:hypothetical protein
MIQTTTLLTTYNGDIMGNSFLKVKSFLRELFALLMAYLPALPTGRQAQAGIMKRYPRLISIWRSGFTE